MAEESGTNRGGPGLHSPTGRRRSSRGLQGAAASKSQVELEKVLGITVSSNSSITCDANSGLIAYPAGCVVVLLCPRKNKQTHIFNTCSKPFSALSFSPDGKFIVTGDSGHKPAVRVWDAAEKVLVSEMFGHKYGVSCVCFSNDMKYVVSVGYQHDMVVNVWDWKVDNIVAKNKVSSKVTAVSFSEDSSYFVTVGNRHVKFWYMEPAKKHQVNGTVPLVGRSGLLGDLHNNTFCSVACGKGKTAGSTFCISASGILCQFSQKRILEKCIKLKVAASSCLSVTEKFVFCGCEDGIVRIFDAQSLQYLSDLPKPHPLGMDVTLGIDPSVLFAKQADATYPDTCALVYDESNQWLCCVYNDHSLYVWDVNNTRKVGKVYSALYHSSYVWNVEIYPEAEQKALVLHGSFFTCSSDNTIRLWNIEQGSTLNLRRNIYSNDLHKVIYVDNNVQHLKDVSGTSEKSDARDPKRGVRVLKVRPDGHHLASGDRAGSIRIYDLETFEEYLTIEAHDGEVLCLEYSHPLTGLMLLASASRDRLLHVFNVERDYALTQTLDDHSASITSVKFAGEKDQMHMISCGADKSIYFRPAQLVPEGITFHRLHHIVEKTTLYDMDVDVSQKTVAVACQDKNIRFYNVLSGKQERALKGSASGGALLKVQMDPSGTFFATSCSNKNISLFDLHSGECVAAVYGHSDIVTDMKFTYDCRRLITVSGDSCVFIWQLDPAMTCSMRQRLRDIAPKPAKPPANPRRETWITHFLEGSHSSEDFFLDKTSGAEDPSNLTPSRDGLETDPSFLQTNGRLPLWMRKQDGDKKDTPKRSVQNAYQPRGRWAQNDSSLAIRNLLDNACESCVCTPNHDQCDMSFIFDADLDGVEPQNLHHLLEQSEAGEQPPSHHTFIFDVTLDSDIKLQSMESSGSIFYPSSSWDNCREESDFAVEEHHTLSDTFDLGDGTGVTDFFSSLQDREEADSLMSDGGSEAGLDENDSQENSHPSSPDQEKFFMEHFETLTDVYEEKFDNSLSDLLPDDYGSDFVNPRLSISARFHSHCLKNSRDGDLPLLNGHQSTTSGKAPAETECGHQSQPRKPAEKAADGGLLDGLEKRKPTKRSDVSKLTPTLPKLMVNDKAALRTFFPGCWASKDKQTNKGKNKTYMGATASSKAKILRSVSMGENLNTTQVEDQKKTTHLSRPESTMDLFCFEQDESHEPVTLNDKTVLISASHRQIPLDGQEPKARSFLNVTNIISDNVLMPPPAACGVTSRLKKAKSVSNLAKPCGKDESSSCDVQKPKWDSLKVARATEKMVDSHGVPKRRYSSAYRSPVLPDCNRRFSIAEIHTSGSPANYLLPIKLDSESCSPGVFASKDVSESPAPSSSHREESSMKGILSQCEAAIEDLHGAFQKALKVYHEIECCDGSQDEKMQLRSLFSNAFDHIQSAIELVEIGGKANPAGDLDSAGQRSKNPTLDLLEHYSEMLLSLMRQKIDHKPLYCEN
uniref:WD repeat domain 62 n=1 Tax=Leptobrachium leishanense TaxID=445787 RepID=A0A8C5MGN8_9ANUR